VWQHRRVLTGTALSDTNRLNEIYAAVLTLKSDGRNGKDG